MVDHTRTLDFKIAFAIGLGTMITAGIFSLSGATVAIISRNRRLIQWVLGSTPTASSSDPLKLASRC